MNRKFDFSEIDGALPDAEKMQERERMTEALEENCKAVRVLCDRMERLETRLSETLPIVDGAVSSLQQAGRVTVSKESRQALEREGDAICRKMADRMESECSKLIGRLSAGNRVIISSTAFWCMIEDSSSLRQPSSASVPQTCISCTAYGCGSCSAVSSCSSPSALR